MSEGSRAWVRALSAVAGLTETGRTLPQRLPELAEHFGPRPALGSETGSFTYTGLAARANQYGHWALQQGLRPGEVVCLMMPNCAEYTAIWLGISGVGGVVAFLNTGLRQGALTHAIDIVAPRHVLADVTSGRRGGGCTSTPVVRDRRRGSKTFNYPHRAGMSAPSWMSRRRDRPRHMTVLPGGGSLPRAR